MYEYKFKKFQSCYWLTEFLNKLEDAKCHDDYGENNDYEIIDISREEHGWILIYKIKK
jgi:hypothetical protein